MKTFIVTTKDNVNQRNLYSIYKEEFRTSDIEEAKRVFETEVEQLRKEDRRNEITDPLFDFPTHEPSSAVFCDLHELIYDEDGELSDIVNVCSSEFFYIPY